jgi:hypothetical protein
MTTNEILCIRKAFQDHYFDLGIYRWMVRNMGWWVILMGSLFSMFLIMAFFSIYTPLLIWFWTALTLVIFGAIDHMIIGFSMNKILYYLRDEDIHLTLSDLLRICHDLLPR